MDNPQTVFDAMRMILRNAAPNLSAEDGRAVIESINEWSCDVLNEEVLVSEEVNFPYEQGDGGF